jgi:hypothetical protein
LKQQHKNRREKNNSRFLNRTLNLKARRAWNDIFKALKENNCEHRLLHLAKLPIVIEGKIKPSIISKN